MTTAHLNGKPDTEADRMLCEWRKGAEYRRTKRVEEREQGAAALRRLLPIAQRFTGQGERVASILLGLYNGRRFPLDLTNLRSLDDTILDDVLTVFRMDANAYQEVHRYFDNGGQVFEKLAEDWGFNKEGGAA